MRFHSIPRNFRFGNVNALAEEIFVGGIDSRTSDEQSRVFMVGHADGIRLIWAVAIGVPSIEY